jgi:hypothetical protein
MLLENRSIFVATVTSNNFASASDWTNFLIDFICQYFDLKCVIHSLLENGNLFLNKLICSPGEIWCF